MATADFSGTLFRKVGRFYSVWTPYEARLDEKGVLSFTDGSYKANVASAKITFPEASSVSAPHTPFCLDIEPSSGERVLLCVPSSDDLALWRAALGQGGADVAELAPPEPAEGVQGEGPLPRPPFQPGQAAGESFPQRDAGMHCWSPQVAEHYQLRLPNYAREKKKGPSPPALYECLGMDTFVASERRDYVSKMVTLPSWDVASPHPLVPKFIILNTQVPQYLPNFRAQLNGETMHVVWYFALRPETAAMVGSDGTTEHHALRCLMRFLEAAPTDLAWQSRLKVIGEMDNLSVGGALGATINAYNGKPVLLRRGVSVLSSEPGPDRVTELVVNVHMFNFISRRALYSLQSRWEEVFAGYKAADTAAGAEGGPAANAAAESAGDAPTGSPSDTTPPNPPTGAPDTTSPAEAGSTPPASPSPPAAQSPATPTEEEDSVEDMLVNFALMIESREEDELPECVLGACTLRNLNPAMAAAEVRS